MLIQAPLMICKNLPNQKCVKKPILLRHHFLQNHYVFRGRMDWDYSPNEQEKGNVYTFTAYQYNFISSARVWATAQWPTFTTSQLRCWLLHQLIWTLVDFLNFDLEYEEKNWMCWFGLSSSMNIFHGPKWCCPDSDVPLLEKRKLRPEM